jgi:hypothetical protein
VTAGCKVAEALVATLLSQLESVRAAMLKQGSIVQVLAHDLGGCDAFCNTPWRVLGPGIPMFTPQNQRGGNCLSYRQALKSCIQLYSDPLRKICTQHDIVHDEQVTSHHFLPPGRAHHVTLTYPKIKADLEMNELSLQPYR